MVRKSLLLFLLSLLVPSFLWGAVTISVSPTSDQILPGSVRSVYSNVQGATALNVTWTASGGTIQESTGYYAKWKAPLTPGTYTVAARSAEDTTKTALTTFTVVSGAVVKVSNIPAQVTAFKNQPVNIQSILWGSTNTTVTWSNSGGTLRGAGREVVFSATDAGTYTVTATSSADNSKTATTTIVVTTSEYPAKATANKTQPVDCTATGSGNTYDVTSEATMDAVPWSSLGAGDTVRIHPGTYHKQILISTSGTASQPIRVCGVSDGSGNLPEINGANAVALTGANYGATLQPYGGILIFDRNVAYYGGATYPKNIIIEGLKVTGFNKNSTFKSLSTGIATNYVQGVAPIRIQHGANITIRGNELSYCDNGLFTMSNNGVEANATRNLLVEGNYFHDNGVANSSTEHQSYLQTFGLVVQGNYYGDVVATGVGSQLKTRSVQQFIRYNYFKPSARILDLVEVQDSAPLVFPFIGVAEGELVNTSVNDVVSQHEGYQDKFVYGNIINNIGNSTAAWVVHGTADNFQSQNAGGNLYFYFNTVAMSFIHTSNWRAGLFDFGNYGNPIDSNTVWPTAILINNAIYIEQPATPVGLCFFWHRYKADRVVINKNWISTGWGTGNLSGGDGTGISNDVYNYPWQGGTVTAQVSGLSNIITGTVLPFDQLTFTPTNNGPLIGTSVSLPNLANDLPPIMNFNLATRTMTIRPSTADIGAIGATDGGSPPIIKNIFQKG